jgi:cation transporter-like permease
MIVLISLPGVVVVERDGLGRCFALIKNRWWATFGRLLVATVIGIVYYALVSFIAHAIGGGPNSAIAAIVQAVLLIPLTVATTAVIVVTYAELRSHQPDGAATGTLAAQLEG